MDASLSRKYEAGSIPVTVAQEVSLFGVFGRHAWLKHKRAGFDSLGRHASTWKENSLLAYWNSSQCARSSADRASDYESESRGFKSLRAHAENSEMVSQGSLRECFKLPTLSRCSNQQSASSLLSVPDSIRVFETFGVGSIPTGGTLSIRRLAWT